MTVSEPWWWHYLRCRHLNELSAGNLGSHVLLVRILSRHIAVVILYHRVVSLSGLFEEALLFAYFCQSAIVEHVFNGLSRHKVGSMQNVARRPPWILSCAPHSCLIDTRLRLHLLRFRLVVGRALLAMACSEGVYRLSLVTYTKAIFGQPLGFFLLIHEN